MAGEPHTAPAWLVTREAGSPHQGLSGCLCLSITWESVNVQTARPTPDILTREGWCGFHNSAFLVSSKEGWGGPLRNAAGHHERLAPLKPTK